MVDVFDKEKRSDVMRRVKSTNTRPEVLVRSLLHRMGYRFRLHNKLLPGKPDICLPKYKTVIFVHGCFWHQHEGCKISRMPSTNTTFWKEKFARNLQRDLQATKSLKLAGWKVLIVWECELKKPEKVASRLKQRLKTNT